MNALTKEELQALIPLLSMAIDLFQHKCDEYYLYCNLYDKIRSMIENYHDNLDCSHEWIFLNRDKNKCRKCGIIE
jgi:hypothetical protein